MTRKEPSAIRINEGHFLGKNDTVNRLVGRLGQDCALIALDGFYEKCSDVKKAVSAQGLAIAQNKAIIVPKTLVVRSDDGLYALITSLEHEQYSKDIVNRSWGRVYGQVTHEGVDTNALIGRQPGECSILLQSDILGQFTSIIVTDALYTKSHRDSSMIVYSLGEQQFFCGVGKIFWNEFSTNVAIQKEGGL